MRSKSLFDARTTSTRLSRSNSCFQSASEIRRKLVMMLRTETFAAPCWRWTSRTTASVVVSCTARRSSSQFSAGVIFGSWSRNRCTSWTAKAFESARRSCAESTTAKDFGRSAALAQQAIGGEIRRLPLCAAIGDLSREASKILDQNDPERDRHRPEFADGERLHLLIGP